MGEGCKNLCGEIEEQGRETVAIDVCGYYSVINDLNFASLGSIETGCTTVGRAAAWPHHRGRGQLQCWSAAAGVSGKGLAQEEHDTSARRGHCPRGHQVSCVTLCCGILPLFLSNQPTGLYNSKRT